MVSTDRLPPWPDTLRTLNLRSVSGSAVAGDEELAADQIALDLGCHHSIVLIEPVVALGLECRLDGGDGCERGWSLMIPPRDQYLDVNLVVKRSTRSPSAVNLSCTSLAYLLAEAVASPAARCHRVSSASTSTGEIYDLGEADLQPHLALLGHTLAKGLTQPLMPPPQRRGLEAGTGLVLR
jgi:hypothetical protein